MARTLPPQQFNLVFLAIVVAVLIAAFVLLQRVGHSPFGRVLRAIRDDEDVAAVAGKHVLAFKVKAFAVGAAVTRRRRRAVCARDILCRARHLRAAADAEHHPRTGGRRRGQQRGAVLGAVLIVALLEGTRFIAPFLPFLAPAQIAAVRELSVSVLLLVILRVLPASASCRSGIAEI